MIKLNLNGLNLPIKRCKYKKYSYIYFKIKTVTRETEGHNIMIKVTIQEDLTIVNICTQHRSTSIHVRQILTAIKWESGRNTIIVGEMNTPLIEMDRPSI